MTTQAMTGLVVRLALACMAIAASAARAETIFMSVTAQAQGVLRGDAGKAAPEGKMSALRFRYQVLTAVDTATGRASGRRQHKPVVITKLWSAASPQLFQALVNNENLPEVVIDFVATDANGIVVLTHRVRLVNAKVVDIAHSTEVPSEMLKVPPRQIEDVSFTFQRIELEDTAGKIAAVDDMRTAP